MKNNIEDVKIMTKPDKWMIIRFNEDYKVFATWAGGYTTGDSWKLNSGIVRIEEEDDFYIFHGYSGSFYYCNKNSYGTTTYGLSILDSHQRMLQESGTCNTMNILDDCNWIEFFKDKLD